MKRYILLTVVALGLAVLCPGNAQATTTNGLVSAFSLVGLSYPTNSPVVTTNAIGNIITSTYTTKPITLSTKNILDLVQAEFSTIFPTGAHLAYSLNTSGFVVLDSSGNLILKVATNSTDPHYSFALSNAVYSPIISGKSVETKTATATNTVLNVTEHLPDYGLYYTDGKSNNFHFAGVIVLKINAVESPTNTLYKTVSITLTGSGGGSIFNPATGKYDQEVYTSASWVAAGSNIPQ